MTGLPPGVEAHPELPRIQSWMEERKEEMADFLEQLVRAESPTTRPELQEEVFRLLSDAFDEAGHSVRRYSGRITGGQLLSRPRSRIKGRPYQMILGHVDTVWPSGTLEKMPVERKDGQMTGPGIFDMKGGLAQLAFALRALAELEIEPEVTPVVFLNSDEEIGSVESEDRIRHLARRASRSLVLEPGLDLDGKLKTARRGVGRFDVRVIGRSSHTGLAPQEGASAIQELSHVIQKLHAISDARRGITVNVGQIQGGTRPNVVAAEATAVVDVRVRTMEDGRWVEQRMEELSSEVPSTKGTRIEIVGEVGRPPMERTPRNQALWEGARIVGRALGLELEQGTSGGASDGNITSRFTATLDGLGCVGDGAHAVHEYAELGKMPERAALLAGICLLPHMDLQGLEATGSSASRASATHSSRSDGAPSDRTPSGEVPSGGVDSDARSRSASGQGDAGDADTRDDLDDVMETLSRGKEE